MNRDLLSIRLKPIISNYFVLWFAFVKILKAVRNVWKESMTTKNLAHWIIEDPAYFMRWRNSFSHLFQNIFSFVADKVHPDTKFIDWLIDLVRFDCNTKEVILVNLIQISNIKNSVNAHFLKNQFFLGKRSLHRQWHWQH